MIAYEDLVVALTNWRINQGLPTGADAFAAFESGSVDLALPVADPVELSTSEVVALDAEDANDIEEHEVLETAVADPSELGEGFDSFAEDETSLAAAPEGETLYEAADADIPMDQGFEEEQSLDYGDEETAYGGMPNMDEAGDVGVAETAVAADISTDVSNEALAAMDEVPEAPPLEDPQTEEVGALDAGEANADDMVIESEALDADALPIEEEVDANALAVEEDAVDADAMPLEEEVDADELAVEEDGNEFDQDEVPTKFGAEDDRESTVLGIGVDELVPPDKG